MAILAMSPMGILPMVCCFFCGFYGTTTTTAKTRHARTGMILIGKMPVPHSDMGKMPMLHSDMGKMPMLHSDMGKMPMLRG
jgi:hypothetical protein